MPLIGLARLEIGRDRLTDVPELARAPQRIAQRDSNRGDNHRPNSRRQLLPGSFSPIHNDDTNSRPALSSRNTMQGNSSRANNRRQTLPSSLAPSENDNGNENSPSSRSILDSDGDDETSLGGAEAPHPPTRRATEPPPYRTVESLALRSNRDSSRPMAPHEEDQDNSRSQTSRTQNRSGAAFEDFMKNLQSRVFPSNRQHAASPAHQNRSEGSSGSPGRRGPLGTAVTDFMQNLSLTLFSNGTGAASDVREARTRPRGISKTVTTTKRRHRRSGKRSRVRRDSSDSDSSDSDDAADDNGLVKITKTYRPVGRGSSGRDGGGTAGVLRRVATETGGEILKGVQDVAVARIAAGLSKDKERKDGGLKDQKPRPKGSFLLDLAVQAGRKMGEDKPEVIYPWPTHMWYFGSRSCRG